MKDIFTIAISARRATFEFKLTIQHNLSLIVGDSAIMETYLEYLIHLHEHHDCSVYVKIASKYNTPCQIKTLTSQLWQEQIARSQNTIFFIFNESFVQTKEFAEAIRNTNNYFVLIDKHVIGMNNLLISVAAVYKFEKTLRGETWFIFNDSLFNTGLQLANKQTAYETIITGKNTKANHYFRLMLSSNPNTNKECIGVVDTSALIDTIERLRVANKPCIIVADKASFGVPLYTIRNYLKMSRNDNVYFWLPECFEWILLQNYMFIHQTTLRDLSCKPAFAELKAVFNATDVLVESAEYTNLAQYFTNLYAHCCRELGQPYDKTQLPSFLIKEDVLYGLAQYIPFDLQS